MAHTDNLDPILRNAGHQREDRFATELANRTEKWYGKAEAKKPAKPQDSGEQKKGPAGGFDSTPLPKAAPGYTIKFTFHRAENLPFSDINTISSDPYVHATLKTNLQKRHKQDPDLQLRTPTVHRNVNPKWETEWIVANVPASGFFLKCRLYDEDPADHDDRLGNVHVYVDEINDNWEGFRERAFDIKKRMGSKRAYFFRGCAAMLNRNIHMSGTVVISVENLGKTEAESGARMWTVGPLPWSRHYSPLIGRLAGTKDVSEAKDGKKAKERYNFQAVQMQLQGPIPEELYHRYVEFKPFVAGMFNAKSLRGRILNRALHHQHARIYNYDRSTLYGVFPKPCKEMTKQFLDFVHYDQGGRIFTYVMTLDSQWRFTETGKEFGIDMLSKHTMHSNVSIYIAFSGEFFVRRLRKPHRVDHEEDEDQLREGKGGDPEKETHLPAPEPEDDDGHASTESGDPSHYELIIDNDSGTYRPNAKLLGQFRQFLEHNLPGLRVATLDCQGDADKMGKLKDEQRERKKKSKGGKEIMYMQNGSSLSSINTGERDTTDATEQRNDRGGDQQQAANGPRTKEKIDEKKDQVSAFKRAAKEIKNVAANPQSLGGAGGGGGDSASAEHGGFVGQDAPVLQKERGEKPSGD